MAGGRRCEAWVPPLGLQATRSILRQSRPSALICLNDHLALGAFQALAEAGLRVPDDVSVMAFDDVPLAAWLRPGLTTVALPHRELGRAAIDLLCDLVDGDTKAGSNGPMRLPMPVRHRESVGPPQR